MPDFLKHALFPCPQRTRGYFHIFCIICKFIGNKQDFYTTSIMTKPEDYDIIKPIQAASSDLFHWRFGLAGRGSSPLALPPGGNVWTKRKVGCLIWHFRLYQRSFAANDAYFKPRLLIVFQCHDSQTAIFTIPFWSITCCPDQVSSLEKCRQLVRFISLGC